MAKENIKNNRIDLKVAVFWALILAVTILFAVLFAMRIHDTRIFDSYDDLKSAKLNLTYDISSEEGDYYVYIYQAKENSAGKLVDSSKTDIIKANEVLPTVFNYFNYVRRNERSSDGVTGFYRIYGYNVKNSKDNVLQELGLELSQLPVLVKVNDGEVSSPIIKANDIQKELTASMKK